LDDLKFLVLDEADELLTPNFKMQIEGILDDSPKEKQVMLFSATMPPDIRSVTKRYGMELCREEEWELKGGGEEVSGEGEGVSGEGG
jgi:ATP-dependent RNA helicase DeaD